MKNLIIYSIILSLYSYTKVAVLVNVTNGWTWRKKFCFNKILLRFACFALYFDRSLTWVYSLFCILSNEINSIDIYLISVFKIDCFLWYPLKKQSRKRNTANPVANWRGDVDRLHPAETPFRTGTAVPALAIRCLTDSHYNKWPINKQPYDVRIISDELQCPITPGCNASLFYNAESEGYAVHFN